MCQDQTGGPWKLWPRRRPRRSTGDCTRYGSTRGPRNPFGVVEPFPEGVAAADAVCHRCTRVGGVHGVYPQVPALVCNRAGTYPSEYVRAYPVFKYCIRYLLKQPSLQNRISQACSKLPQGYMFIPVGEQDHRRGRGVRGVLSRIADGR